MTTVAQTGEAWRASTSRWFAHRHTYDGDPRELRVSIARLCHGARWCEARTDPAEPWDKEAWLPIVAAELTRRRCAECGRLRGRAAIAGGYCVTCQADHRARGCGGCGSPLPGSGVCPVCATRAACAYCGSPTLPCHCL